MADELREGDLVGDFRIIKYLGQGAAGRAYLATPVTHKPFARPGDLVALKVYKEEILREPSELARIRREFDVGSADPHPRLVRVLEHSLDSTPPFLVMEYVDGTPLDQWIKMFHPVPSDLTLRIAEQVVEGIAHLHDRGLVHRDVKPENVMVTPSFDVKVMDLGVVWSDSGTRLTPEGEHLGTTRNSSPELLLGKGFDRRTDLYSLGTVIYAVLHGHQIFAAESHSKRLAEMVIHEVPAFDQGLRTGDAISAGLLDLAERLLAKNPEQRPSSAAEVRHELARLEDLAPATEFEPLHGYVATALTGLDADAKEAIDFAAGKIAEVAKAFRIYVYQPRRFTDPIFNSDVDPATVYLLDRRRVLGADVLFVLANKPSFGVGQELEIASTYAKPMVLVAREGATVSRMMRGSFANLVGEVTYAGPEDLEFKLRRLLGTVVARLRGWRQRTATPTAVVVAQRFREARERAGYANAAEFASRMGISTPLVEALERGEYENIGVQLLSLLSRELGSPLASLLESSAPAARIRPAGDANLERLEQFSREMQLSAREYLEMRDDYLRQIAASGEPLRLMKTDWMNRRRALEERRFREAEAGRPEGPSRLDEHPGEQPQLPL